MKKVLYYFGCIQRHGHYLWAPGEYKVYEQVPDMTYGLQSGFDGTFRPPSHVEEGQAMRSFVPPWTILCWHDHSVDRRPGSVSAFIFTGYGDWDKAWEEVLRDAEVQFPSVIKRQPKPLMEWRPA